MSEEKTIRVCGARVHNLKNVDVEIPRDKLTAENLAEGLRALISNPEYTRNAACIGEALRNEHGCANAADLIEKAVWDWENGNPAQDGMNI